MAKNSATQYKVGAVDNVDGVSGGGGGSGSVRQHQRLRQDNGEAKMVFDTSGGGGDSTDGGGAALVLVSVLAGGGGGSAGGGDGRCRSIVVNGTIFLPISKGTFVNANNPLLMRY